MAFSLTAEDFERYVTKSEHGGKHLWDEILPLLQSEFGCRFEARAYEKRGDNLKVMWFHPSDAPRQSWSNQGHFFLSRSIEDKTLASGLMIERPDPEMIRKEQLDADIDAARLQQALADDPGFRSGLDELARKSDWQVLARSWSVDAFASMGSAAELQAHLESIPADTGYGVRIQRVLSADQALAKGPGIAEEIVSTFRTLARMWQSVLPQAAMRYLQAVAPSPSFLDVMRAYQEAGTVFQSADRGARYAVSSVDDSGCIIERLTANESERCTQSLYDQKLALVRDNEGIYPLGDLDPTAAKRTAFLQGVELGLSADREQVLDLSILNKALANFIELLQGLNVDQSGGEPRLHKPAMAACVLEALLAGEISENVYENLPCCR